MYFKLCLSALASALVPAHRALADGCPSGSSMKLVDGIKKCVPNESVTVIIDPEWLVAGGLVLVLLVLTTLYLAIKVSQLAEGLERSRRGRS